MDALGQSQLTMSRSFLLVFVLFVLGNFRIANGQPKWPYETKVGAFQVHADFSLKNYQAEFTELAQLHTEVAKILGLGPHSKETHFYVFRKKSTYRKYLNRYFPGISQRRAMFIQQSGIGMVFAYRSKRLMTDLRHEGTHAILHGSLPMVPLWLDEGLAEYFEVPAPDRQSKNPHLDSIRSSGTNVNISSIQELKQLSDFSKMQNHHYRDAWAWVHFMLHRSDSTRQALRSHVSDIQQHVPPGDLTIRLEKVVPDLELEFRKHFFAERVTPLMSQKPNRLFFLKSSRYSPKKSRQIRN